MSAARNFTEAAQAAGLSLRGISTQSAATLQGLAAEPLTLRKSEHGAASTSAAGAKLGPLIRHGLARLDREAEAYVITEQGREYLAKLEAAGLIGKGVAA